MNIQSYRKKFILIAMMAMTSCLVLLLLLINLFNLNSVITEQQDILSILSENDGHFPPFNSQTTRRRPGHPYQITAESEHRISSFVTTPVRGTRHNIVSSLGYLNKCRC